MVCPICGKKLNTYIKTKNFEIDKCEYCGFGVTKNLRAHLGNYHRDEEYLNEEKLFQNIFQKRANLISKFIKKGSILEIGCSTGILLKLLKNKGLSVFGIEISKPAAKLAEEKGIKVFKIPFEKFQTKEKFDCFILSHTLEHLDNPFLSIQKASVYLKRGGILFIDLPNFEAFSSKVLKENWPHLLAKEHLWHFTYKSLKILLKKNNFEIIYSDMSSGIWDLDNPMGEIFNSLFSFKKRFFVSFITFIPSFIISKLKIGSGLMIIAKKL